MARKKNRSTKAASERSELAPGLSERDEEDQLQRNPFRKSLAVDRRRVVKPSAAEEDGEESNTETEDFFCSNKVWFTESAKSGSRIGRLLCFPQADVRFRRCFVQVNGLQVFVFDNCVRRGGKLVGDGLLLMKIQIKDNFLVLGPRREKQGGECEVAFQEKQSRKEFIRFKFEDSLNAQTFSSTIKHQVDQYKQQLQEAMRFEEGDFSSDTVDEYKLMLKNGLINREEFSSALLQQVSNDAEHLDVLVGAYGEDAYADFKIRCPECGEDLFNLPSEPLTTCPQCGYDDLDSPDVLEGEAQAVINGVDLTRLDTRRGSHDSFPLLLDRPPVKFHFNNPILKPSKKGGLRGYKYVMAWSRKVDLNGEDWQDFKMVVTWDKLKMFFESGIADCADIPQETLEKIPPFPDDDETLDSVEAHVEHRLQSLNFFLVVFLNLFVYEGLDAYKPIRKILGCRV